MNADDHQMEEMLKRYRPKGPGPALRQRVLGDTRGVASSGHANWPLRVAATIALVAGLAGALWWQKDRSRVPVAEPSADHIEFSIQRVGEAAQLLAAADILAAQPGAGAWHAGPTRELPVSTRAARPRRKRRSDCRRWTKGAWTP